MPLVIYREPAKMREAPFSRDFRDRSSARCFHSEQLGTHALET